MKRANKTVIGGFVIVAAALLVVAIAVVGSGTIFRKPDTYTLFFDRSVKGLSVGASVIFKGVKIGNVVDIDLVYDPQANDELIEAVIDVDLTRVRGVPEKLGYPDYKSFIDHGLRAKLDMQSFVTGQLIISFEFYPDKPSKLYDIKTKYPQLPTLPTSPYIFEAMEDIPVKEIASNLNQIVATVNKLMSQQTFAELDRSLRELTAAARSTRLLMEYLEEHPEALLKGKLRTKDK